MCNNDKVKCPYCGHIGNTLISTNKTAGTIIGGGAGFFIGCASAKKGAIIGAKIGYKFGAIVPVLGKVGSGLTGGIVGGLSGMLTGATIGSVAGECIDKYVVGEFQCKKCERTFQHKEILSDII